MAVPFRTRSNLGLLCPPHHCYAVSRFSSNDVLYSRPFVVCLCYILVARSVFQVSYVETHSRRVSAVNYDVSFGQLLLINVYITCEKWHWCLTKTVYQIVCIALLIRGHIHLWPLWSAVLSKIGNLEQRESDICSVWKISHSGWSLPDRR